MSREIRVQFEDFSSNLPHLMDRVTRDKDVVVIEREGSELATLAPAMSRGRVYQGKPAAESRPRNAQIVDLDSVYRTVPSLGLPITDQDMTQLASEEHAQHVVQEGRD